VEALIMNNFCKYITPAEARQLDIETEGGRREPIEYYLNLQRDKRKCIVCDERVWKLVDTGLCFSCTTGESDASGDYELVDI
jgi:hypothetical protein